VPEVAKTTYHEAILRKSDFVSEQTAGPLRAL